MTKAPRQREVLRATIAPGLESLAVVVSCGEANAVRSVVTLCELRADPAKRLRGLPTVVDLPASDSGLASDLVAIASPYTVPKACLARGGTEGFLPPRLYESLEEALKRVLGWAPWPD